MYLNSTLQRRCKQVQPRTAEIQSDEDWVTKIIPFSLSFLFLKLKLFNLGVKKLGDHEVFPDDILIRQRGFKWHAGENTYVGKDHTIHSKIEVIIFFVVFFVILCCSSGSWFEQIEQHSLSFSWKHLLLFAFFREKWDSRRNIPAQTEKLQQLMSILFKLETCIKELLLLMFTILNSSLNVLSTTLLQQTTFSPHLSLKR